MTTALKKDNFFVKAQGMFETTGRKRELTPRENRMLENSTQDLHHHFASLSVPQRTLILSALLVPGSDRTNKAKFDESYDKALEIVMGKAFPERMEKAGDTKAFVHAYLKTAARHERVALLAGMTPKKAGKLMDQLAPLDAKLAGRLSERVGMSRPKDIGA